MKYKGFTVAEILITMAIIGFIAAIVLPTLKDAQANKEMIMFKKVLYQTSNVVNELINDDNLYPDSENPLYAGLAHVYLTMYNNFANEAKFRGQTYGGSGNAGKYKFCGLFAAKMSLKTSAVCNDEKTFANKGNFTTSDGVVWRMPISDFGSGTSESGENTIEVDVNGVGKGKDCFEGETNCTEPDRFRILVNRWGKISLPEKSKNNAYKAIEKKYATEKQTNKKYKDLKELAD